MIKGDKRKSETDEETENSTKKPKPTDGKGNISKDDSKSTFQKHPNNQTPTQKPDWNTLKKEKKELKIKRKQANKFYDVIVEAKKIFETLRQKQLKGGKDERNELIDKLHGLFVGKGQYAKVIFAHDVARIVQFLFKFGNERIRKEVADELIPVTVDMLQSKYGRRCLKSMLMYGNSEIRSASIQKMYGNAVKFTSHAISAAVFEYAYSTWATPKHKQCLVQEFFGDIYKQVKDAEVKHLRDVYQNSPNMKTAALQATKANLSRVLNKDLLDSGIVQTVLYQYLSECSPDDKAELISQLAPHAVVISNSKDGAKAAMQCIWHGSNKDRKVIMKAIKEHVKDLSKHEHGHCTVIGLLDAVDDTVLLNKMILTPILSEINALAADEHGRKVLLWLVAPADSTHFHPLFINELEEGRAASSSKKPLEQRRQELLNYTVFTLINEVISNTNFWMSSGSIAMLTLAIVKSAPIEHLQDALNEIAKVVVNTEWTVDKDDEKLLGIEHPGLHMILKKLIQHDKVFAEAEKPTFSSSLLNEISDETITKWLTINRGCFLFVALYENGTEELQNLLKEKLQPRIKKIKSTKSSGAKILLQKLK
ncbi:hypothetical protein RN001_014311 [Aquatica leii]|uniref:PUM-HD domain-containing protein n=1 Tax=Aquatica leii TaxID=1421715 RepID=A0AAN7S7E8_9COLE|nr:hypothetical protein RN001_014311 [Aquatica leii]